MSNILKGKLGWKGEKGDSAYEISVKHGYTGTEEQWSEDFLNADNYYDKPEANALLATKANASDVYTKGDYAILTGSVANTELSLGGKTVDYPEGFGQNNCVVISAMKHNHTTSIWTNYYSIFDITDQMNDLGLNIQMFAAGIKLVTLTNYVKNQADPNEKWGYDYRVVLMKIPTE